jgi:serine/threonine protein kinase
MDLAGNMDLDKFVSHKDIPVSLFVEIERAICSMWLAGYIHGDLHRANLMIDTRTYSIKLIDFGFALKMPPGFVDVLARRISNMIARGDMKSLGEVWTEKPIDGKLRLINYSNRVMKGKGYPWYNPDYKILRTLFNQVPRKLRNQIPAARSALWGIKMGDVAALPQQRRTSRRKTAIRSTPALSSRVARTYRTSRRSSPLGPKTASISEVTGRRQESARRKEELARQQSAKKKQEELARQQSAKKKQEELARQQSAKKKQEELARQQSAKKKQEEIARQQSAKKKEELARQQSAKKKEELARQQSARKKEELARQQSARKKEELARQITKKKSASPQWMQKRSPQTKLSSPLRKLSNAERAAVYGQKRRSPNTAIADLQRRKADCQQRGLFYNPILKQCVRSVKTPVTPGRCREDCAAIGKRCGPKGRCVKL